MGCVVWQWDMLGESDCLRLSHELVHRFAKPRPDINAADGWGLYSPRAEARLQSVMGLQAWNSVRSLDLLRPTEGPAARNHTVCGDREATAYRAFGGDAWLTRHEGPAAETPLAAAAWLLRP